MTEPLTLAQRGAALTPMQDHIDRFWRMLETEHVRLSVDMRRDTTSVPYWDSSSFPDEVAKALVADRASLRDANKALTAGLSMERELVTDMKASVSEIEGDRLFWKDRATAAEAKLAKVEANLEDAREQITALVLRQDRLSAELAEARQNYVDANEARLDALRVLEKIADARMPGEARKLAVEHLRDATIRSLIPEAPQPEDKEAR